MAFMKKPARQSNQNMSTGTSEMTQTAQTDDMSSHSMSENEVHWQQMDGGWKPMGTAPECDPNLTFKLPTDITKVTGILYPGQTRGGNYKPHGGFRMDNAKNTDVSVTAPLDGNVVRGANFLVDGEIQYTFDIMHSCGIMYRVGHLLTLPPKFLDIAKAFPAAQENDSRTMNINPPVPVKLGEVIATSVGVTKPTINTFFDWGVYDMRQKNEASKNASWAADKDPELAPHAVCWFDWLNAADKAKVKSLPPGDPQSGTKSDYCN